MRAVGEIGNAEGGNGSGKIKFGAEKEILRTRKEKWGKKYNKISK